MVIQSSSLVHPASQWASVAKSSESVVLLTFALCGQSDRNGGRPGKTSFCRAIAPAEPEICVPLAGESEKVASDRTNMHSQGNRRNDPWAQKQIEQDEARRTNRCVRLLRPASSLLPLPG